ncbi:hypothetical protein PHJA_001585800 [Phtheirospermum japonicum]|uniref:Uncharacterized protein n=1 Tax=Phtheirospermum japonicum TaxID=374723 RepID=A0A830CDL6_9LAMI|nr:hypothetical protein PHJA_001585800 [Phtheirospermum japonicum]
MGRFGAKGKKLSMTNKDDTVSSEKEKVTAQKRRGRPLKPLKDEINEDETPKMEDEDSEDTAGVPNKDKVDSVEEENGNGTKSSTEEEAKNSNSLRQYRNRRKSKPRRAAEAVVECN